MNLVIRLGAAMLVTMTGVAVAVPATLPVPRHDTLQDYQDACVAQNGFKTFSAQVSCVKALAAESNMDDPSTRLYLLTADKLLDDVRSNRATVPAARVELQRALIDAQQRQQREHAEIVAIQNAKQEQWQAAQRARQQQAARDEEREDEQRQQIAQQRQREQAQADAQTMAAIQNCVAIARERENALMTSTGSVRANYNMQRGLNLAFGKTPESACQSDPNWFRTIPIAPPPTVTQRSHCDSDQMGGYDCTSQ